MFICDSFNLLLNLWVNMLGEMRAIFLRLQKIMFQPPSPDCRMSRLYKDWRGPSERPVQAAPGWTSNAEEHVWKSFLIQPALFIWKPFRLKNYNFPPVCLDNEPVLAVLRRRRSCTFVHRVRPRTWWHSLSRSLTICSSVRVFVVSLQDHE